MRRLATDRQQCTSSGTALPATSLKRAWPSQVAWSGVGRKLLTYNRKTAWDRSVTGRKAATVVSKAVLSDRECHERIRISNKAHGTHRTAVCRPAVACCARGQRKAGPTLCLWYSMRGSMRTHSLASSLRMVSGSAFPKTSRDLVPWSLYSVCHALLAHRLYTVQMHILFVSVHHRCNQSACRS